MALQRNRVMVQIIAAASFEAQSAAASRGFALDGAAAAGVSDIEIG